MKNISEVIAYFILYIVYIFLSWNDSLKSGKAQTITTKVGLTRPNANTTEFTGNNPTRLYSY